MQFDATLEAAKNEIDKLRKALEPFARECKRIDDWDKQCVEDGFDPAPVDLAWSNSNLPRSDWLKARTVLKVE